MTTPKERARGRPRLHKETKMVAFRVPVEMADSIMGALNMIRLASDERDTPYSVLLIDALKARLGQLSNHGGVPTVIRSLDRALNKHFGHVQR